MATIIFDLDDTLFNTARLKRDFFNMLQRETGLSQDELKNYYRKFSREENTFGPDAFLRYLSAHCSTVPLITSEKFFTEINWSLYVDRDLFPMLDALADKHTLWILTKGQSFFQKRKIQNTGLDRLFPPERLIICETSKCEALRPHLFTGNVFFVNDKYHETKEVICAYTNFSPIIFSGFSKRTPLKKDYLYRLAHSFEKLFEILKNEA